MMVQGDDVYRIGSWREYGSELPWLVDASFPLESAKTALIVVDMTNYQCDREAPTGIARSLWLRGDSFADYYFASMDRVVPAIRRLIHEFRERRSQVVFLTPSLALPDGRELPFFMRRVDAGLLERAGPAVTLAPGRSEAWAVIPALKPQLGDLVVRKMASSGFVGTGLELMLRNMNIDTIVLTGAATHACVESTARSGADLGFKIVLAEDACLTQSALFHDMTMMYCLQFNWGMVLRSEEIITEMEGRRAG